MNWVFVLACVAFSCGSTPARPGDGAYYASKGDCLAAARRYAKVHHLSPGRWEPVCVEREKPL